MHRIRHDGRAVGQPATDKFDEGKANIEDERHTDATGAFVMTVMVMVMILFHKQTCIVSPCPISLIKGKKG